ncbi:uncharacterized protein LOC111084965 [Limulus polyphemus]|uniref:Uncharacterized protein LOC111084965 n=1 Tax=Limulus polyphemus TaxID=6850 RepID=A0ABM1S186_LIMPO|nr:uncharacterized protein LOC111084965 [Limulus polyphemus]
MKTFVVAACVFLISVAYAVPQRYGYDSQLYVHPQPPYGAYGHSQAGAYAGQTAYGVPQAGVYAQTKPAHDQSYGNSQSYGREMHYSIHDPHTKSHMQVKEMHVKMDRKMNSKEAEEALHDIMGSMHGGEEGFKDFLSSIGF